MKGGIPSSLFLITAIVLERVVVSSTQIGVLQSLRVLLILLIFAILAFWIVRSFLHDWHYTNFIILLSPVLLILYRALYGAIKQHFPHQATALGLGLIVLLGLLHVLLIRGRVWRLVRNPAQLTSYFNIVFMVLLCFQVLRLVRDGYPLLKHVNRSDRSTALILDPDSALGASAFPDIYVIVLDGYARQDVLQELYGFDNSDFLTGLETRGFYVATESHSNYVQTPYSMASFWNLDYLPTWESSYEYEQYLYQPIQDNHVFRALDEIGYTTVSTGGEVHYTEIRNADAYLSKFLQLNDFETLLLVDSPLEPLSSIYDPGLRLHTYETHRQHIYYQLAMLKKIPAEIEAPKVVYTHILTPHPPFVFDRHGDIHAFEKSFSLAEGAEFSGGREQYVNGYQEQIRFTNKEVIKVVDAILKESKTPPIIIIMGDHGPAALFRFNIEDPGCVWERTSNLNAILLPGHQGDDTLYPSISPVNTFRVIFNTYFGTDLPLLEDKSYLRVWSQPTLNVDVTSSRDSKDQCTVPSEEELALQ